MRNTHNPYRIERIDRLPNSVNGNPRYRFELVEESKAGDGYLFGTLLSSDAAVGYQIGNPGYRVGDRVMVGWTRAGLVRTMRAVKVDV